MKKYLIKESQIKKLVQRKNDKKIFNEIKVKINTINNKLNENVLLNESINTLLYSYKSKGYLNDNILKMLIDSNLVNKSNFK